jgi:glycerate-2-kinase
LTIEQQHAVEIFKAGVEAVQPAQLLPSGIFVEQDTLTIFDHTFPAGSVQNIYVIGAGKASAAMAVETEKILGPLLKSGIVTTKYNHALPCKKIKVLEASHPVPDQSCVNAIDETLEFLKQVTEKDLLICLLSGGASALWCDLPPGITLKEMQTAFDSLIKSGAAIHEINTIRKHLSSIKGGQLIRHCNGATVFSLIISDVPGDNLDIIASGPTVGDDSTFADAYAILSEYGLLSQLPHSIHLHFEKGLQGLVTETPQQSDPLFRRTTNRIIGTNKLAIEAAAAKARNLGYQTYVNKNLITGDVKAEANAMVSLIQNYKDKLPVCLLQGGEMTVKVAGSGKGGRNQHFVLSALKELQDRSIPAYPVNFTILSGGTDGTDGPTDAAGAFADPTTLAKAFQKGLSPREYLENYDAYSFFQQTGDLLITGPTQTNVMDIMLAIVN